MTDKEMQDAVELAKATLRDFQRFYPNTTMEARSFEIEKICKALLYSQERLKRAKEALKWVAGHEKDCPGLSEAMNEKARAYFAAHDGEAK